MRPLLTPGKGIDRHISRSTANGRYFMTESRDAMRLLREYRVKHAKCNKNNDEMDTISSGKAPLTTAEGAVLA